jgi:hypothetical protein
MRLAFVLYCGALLAACAQAPTARSAQGVRIVPDDPVSPTVVRFDVPTALIMGLPGDRVPITLEARIATRELAARELAAAGYCPRGFVGPEAITFPPGDRSRSAFSVRCLA